MGIPVNGLKALLEPSRCSFRQARRALMPLKSLCSTPRAVSSPLTHSTNIDLRRSPNFTKPARWAGMSTPRSCSILLGVQETWLVASKTSTLSCDCAAVCCGTMQCLADASLHTLRSACVWIHPCFCVCFDPSNSLFSSSHTPDSNPFVSLTTTMLFFTCGSLFDCSPVCSSGNYFMTLHISA